MTLTLFCIMSFTIAVAYWLEDHTRWVAHISGVLLLIVIASILGSSHLVPSNEVTYTWLFKWAVPFGIILMLFAFNPKHLLKINKDFLICFAIGALSTAIGAIVAGYLFKKSLPEDYWRVSGQLSATFTGGYENAVAVGTALGTSTKLFLQVFAGDSVLTTLWILVNIFQGRHIVHEELAGQNNVSATNFATPMDLTSLIITLATTGFILLISIFINQYIPSVPKIIWASLLATAMTFFPFKQRFSCSYIIGSLFLSYFFFACGAISDVPALFTNATTLIFFPAIIVVIHALILFPVAKCLGIKKEIVIIASQSLIGGPATALAVVTARKWNYQFEAIVLGLLGYAVGNYIGFGVAYLIR